MTAPAHVDPTLRMHRALMLAARMVSRAAASVAYTALADCHPRTAKDLADLTVELNAMGYIDPLPETAHHRGNTPRLRTAEDEDDD